MIQAIVPQDRLVRFAGEVGILIYLSLRWEYVLGEVVGDLVLIVLSTLLIRATYPRRWLEEAREALETRADIATGTAVCVALFWLNLAMVGVAATFVVMHRKQPARRDIMKRGGGAA